MTDADLLRAIHEYADVTNDRPVNEWDDARTKMFAAIREWADHDRGVTLSEAYRGKKARAAVDKLLIELEAKAAACESFLVLLAKWESGELSTAGELLFELLHVPELKALRELQAKVKP